MQPIFDDSWRSAGERPELLEPVRASLSAKVAPDGLNRGTSVLGRPAQALEASKPAAAEEGNLTLCRVINALISNSVWERITGGPRKAGVPGLEEKPKIQAEWVPHVRFLRFHCTVANREL